MEEEASFNASVVALQNKLIPLVAMDTSLGGSYQQQTKKYFN